MEQAKNLNHYKCTACYDTGMVTDGGPIGQDEDGNVEYDSWQEPCDCKSGIAIHNSGGLNECDV
jgi:hypothetical protein